MEENTKELKKGFFKKAWYSIFKLEKYGEMAAEGVVRAITYLIKLSLIIAIIVSLGTIYQLNGLVKKGINFLDSQVGNFTYKDGILELEKEEPIRAPSSIFGEVIIDTKVETNEEINQYVNSLNQNKGIIILKDKILIKGISSRGIVSYSYTTILDEVNIKELNNQQLIEYVNGKETWKIYVLIFALLLGYSILSAFLPILFNAFMLSLFGYLATWFAKIKIRYAAIFNLASYSLTLSILLHAIYITVNIFMKFTVTYFQIMYVAVAAIYLIASIFLIKSDFIKKQIELTKQMQLKNEEEKEKLEKEEENQEEQKKEPDNDKDKEKKEKKDNKENKDTNNGAEPEGV